MKRVQFFINIYSSETNSWSFSKIKFTWDWGVNFALGLFFKGVIHWTVIFLNQYGLMLKTMRMLIVGDAGLGISGSLEAIKSLQLLKYNIFEMVEDHSDWYLKYSLDLKPQINTVSSSPKGYHLFCAIQSKE
ncbi:hypothetical protein PVK06_005831 [Gossypium arboreum]|uniref:Uncharacterized protein n=1 Tax=Gossypium arboreum TaxID=29729 RepID=A0ABR0QVL4_GOSAR|nr:hypothetical protein PVK06_005831 [Gossypium arboreum]